MLARPASKGQYDYPYSINTSINEVVCHGMPDARAILCDGDIVNIDITLEKNGFIADSSKMYLVGAVSPKARRLVDKTLEALWEGIRVVKPGARLGDIGHAIQKHAEANGYSVVREYCGHGIGRQMHEEPQVLHFGRPGTGMILREGMVFTIEPMLNQGSARTRGLKDGWTVVTRDGSLSAQWEEPGLPANRHRRPFSTVLRCLRSSLRGQARRLQESVKPIGSGRQIDNYCNSKRLIIAPSYQAWPRRLSSRRRMNSSSTSPYRSSCR